VNPYHLLNYYQPGRTDYEDPHSRSALIILATFDHDYCGQHLLVQEWDATVEAPRWTYVLYYLPGDGDPVTVQRYTSTRHGSPPWISAAALAGCFHKFGNWGKNRP
jgi:hypothetical protein